MAVEDASVRAILYADGTVLGLVSTRIYPSILPDKCTMPAITYARISTPRSEDLIATQTLTWPRIQINSWDDDYLGAKALAKAVRIALTDYTGTIGGITISDIRIMDEGDLEEPSPEVESLRRYGVRQDFEVWHDE